MSDKDPICAVCQGKRSEHFDEQGKQITHHVFTEKPGELLTQEQQQKQGQQARPGLSPSMVAMTAGTNPLAMGRLVEVLMESGALSQEQALYIAGYAPKPSTPSGFRDPAMGAKL